MKKNSIFTVGIALFTMILLSSASAAPAPLPDGHIGISVKALKDFKRQFKTVSNEIWSAIPEGYLSTFTNDGVTSRVYYNKKGGWEYTMKTYNEDKLPRDIRAAVKGTYYDYTITCVNEILSFKGLQYIVMAEDKTTIKTIRITDEGGMELIKELDRAH